MSETEFPNVARRIKYLFSTCFCKYESLTVITRYNSALLMWEINFTCVFMTKGSQAQLTLVIISSYIAQDHLHFTQNLLLDKAV